jgi:hypothetical protein
LDQEKKEGLIKSLHKGNVQAVTFEKNGFIEKLFIDANPQFKTLNTYDHVGRQLPIQTVETRFDFVHKDSKAEVNTRITEKPGLNGEQVGKNGTQENKQKNVANRKELPKEENLLPKKTNTDGLMQKKKTSKKGHHL